MINSCDLRAPPALMTFQSGFSSFQGQMIKSSENNKQKVKQIIWVQLIPRLSSTFIIFLHDCRNVLRLYLDELGGEMIIIMIIDHKLCYHLDHRDDNDDQCYHDHDDQ